MGDVAANVRCLVTGATGYVGGRLAPRLIEAGHRVRCLTRSPRRLRDVPWAAGAEVTGGDLLRPDDLPGAFAGVDVAYYLVHSLGSRSFERTDRTAAANFAAAAAAAGVRRIVYLGGPAPAGAAASAHLRSRAEVGTVLAGAGVPTVILRAATIIGSGSASFEMLRHLTERLPVMVTPRWARNRIQPIAISDVLRYLVGWATVPDEVHRAFDIGGPDVLTYLDMMRRYARVAGLPPRVILPVRPLTPTLSAYWVGLVTPVPSGIAKPLVASLIHEAVCQEHDIAGYLPDPPGGLLGFDAAVRLALASTPDAEVDTRRSAAAWTGAPADPLPTDPDWSGASVYVDRRARRVAAPPDVLWTVVRRRYAGGAPGFRRVEETGPGRVLRLRATGRLPGRAWLELRVAPDGDGGGSRYEQRAVFRPTGLAGHLYWKAAAPARAIAFGALARHVAGTAERAAD